MLFKQHKIDPEHTHPDYSAPATHCPSIDDEAEELLQHNNNKQIDIQPVNRWNNLQQQPTSTLS